MQAGVGSAWRRRTGLGGGGGGVNSFMIAHIIRQRHTAGRGRTHARTHARVVPYSYQETADRASWNLLPWRDPGVVRGTIVGWLE